MHLPKHPLCHPLGAAQVYVAFDTMQSLERDVAGAGFAVLARENLFPAPPNLFLAAKKE